MHWKMRDKLRNWLRNLLGLTDDYQIATRRHDELLKMITNLIVSTPSHSDYSTAIQNLQDQIDNLQSIDSPLAKPKPAEPDRSTILSGHIRFSDRKRQYEASKRVPLTTETGKQIEENHRLISSGTRKAE